MSRPGIKRLLHLALRRPQDVERDVDDEIRTHLALRAEHLVRLGWTPEAASDESNRRFGRMDTSRRQLHIAAAKRDRRLHLRELAADAWADLRFGARSLARDPAFAAFVVITLALGIGVNAAMFGVVDRLLLRGPDHIRDASRLKRVQITRMHVGRPPQRSGGFGWVTYDVLRRGARTLDGAAAYHVVPDGMLLGTGAAARRITYGHATADFFPVLGVQPLAGRFFDPKEDDANAPEHVAVLGYGLWQEAFAGSRDAIGRQIALDNTAYTVVGVAPKGFTGPELSRVDVWIPESVQARKITSDWTRTWTAGWVSVIVRLKPGVTLEQANADITEVHERAYSGADTMMTHSPLALEPIQYEINGDERSEATVSKWLFAVAAVVLLVACANVVNLLLARALRRRRELAVRLTLGAGRGRLIRLLVIESVALAATGGAAGVCVAYALGSAMRAWLIPQVEWTSGVVDARVVGVAAGVALLSGLVVGLVPAFQATMPDLTSSLKGGAREGGGRTSRLRTTLTVVQAALSVTLLIGAGLFVQSLRRVRAIDLGVDPEKVLVISVQRTALATTDTEASRVEAVRRKNFYALALANVRGRGDVERASLAIGLAFGTRFDERIRLPGRDSIPVIPGGGPFVSAVARDFFATVGTRIVRGRAFTDVDRAGSAAVAIINETMATTLWPGENPLGKCFYFHRGNDCAQIVGITANAHRWYVQEDDAPAFYVPLGQERGIGGMQLVIRPRGDPHRVLAEVKRQLMLLDPSILYVDGNVMQDSVEPQIRPWHLGATMFSLMGALAIVVAAIGLYSVLSYLVAHRRQEIGIRIALGAQAGDIVHLVLGNGVALAGIGVALGAAIALATARFIQPLLFKTSPRDPVVYASVAALLLLVSVAASAVPALRARRVNPMDAMRAE